MHYHLISEMFWTLLVTFGEIFKDADIVFDVTVSSPVKQNGSFGVYQENVVNENIPMGNSEQLGTQTILSPRPTELIHHTKVPPVYLEKSREFCSECFWLSSVPFSYYRTVHKSCAFLRW